MAETTKKDVTGDLGESLARLLLNRVAFVNDYKKDIGLDFSCELRDDTSVGFYVQAKGSSAPRYEQSLIQSLPIKCKTIQQYWLPKPQPVFVLMSDTTKNKTYYIIANQETYRPSRIGQKTYIFLIPLTNEITQESIGKFVSDVVQNQKNKSQQERESILSNHYTANPELYHSPDEDERLLEIMRCSDQQAQHETKMLLKQRFEAGDPISRKIRDGLVTMFIDCRDVFTQIHILDTLVYINETSVIPEVIKQINRNISRYEYYSAGGRSGDIDFLFQGLVKFKAVEVVNDLNKLLNSKDPNILRAAARTSGELGLKKTMPNLLTLLSHPDENVRLDASQALSLMMDKEIESRLILMLRRRSIQQLDGVIRTLAKTKKPQVATIIADFATDSDSFVRKAVAYCLGKVAPKTRISLLVNMMNDDDLEVREQAKQSVNSCIYKPELEAEIPPKVKEKLSPAEIEEMALPMLKEAYSKDKIPQVEALLHFCKGELSIPTLLEIYFDKKPHQKEFKFYDRTGNLYAYKYIDLKVEVLEVLKKRPIPEVAFDIVRIIEASDSNTDVKYIIAAGEMKIKEAFNPLSKLFLVKNQPYIGWIRSALFSIDPERAKLFACDILKTSRSLDIVMSCFEILQSFMIENGENKDIVDLIKSQIVSLARRRTVRANVRFQTWVKIFKVTDVIPLFMKDMWADKIQVGTSILEMIKNPEGRDLIISKLPSLDSSSKNVLLQWLGSIGDSQSIDAIKAYIDDTDPEISRIAQSIIQKSLKET